MIIVQTLSLSRYKIVKITYLIRAPVKDKTCFLNALWKTNKAPEIVMWYKMEENMIMFISWRNFLPHTVRGMIKDDK